MTLFFTSDTHYHHANVIRFSGRPFRDVDQMHQALVERWNAKVGPTDTVYHLGDVSFSGREQTLAITRQLKGRIRFLGGNHDKKKILRERIDEYVGEYAEIRHENQKIVLCHYPLYTWNKGHHGSWMLHGHCHGSIDELNQSTTRLDVGVDGVAQYAPISFGEVAAIMSTRSYRPVDYHGAAVTE